MEINKRLLMNFKTIGDKKIAISVDSPKEDLTEVQIKSVMDLILSKNIFEPGGEGLVALVDAKIVQTDTTEYDLAL